MGRRMPECLFPLATGALAFLNPQVARVLRAVDTFAAPLGSRLNIPAAVGGLMSRSKPVRKDTTTVYLDPQVRPNLASLLR